MATTSTIDASGDVRDIRMVQGNTFELNITVKTEFGGAIDLTDYDIRYQVRKTLPGPVILNGTLANGKCVKTNAVSGIFKIIVLPTDTTGIPFASPTDDELEMFYDVELTRSPDGQVFKPTRGTFTLIREITR